MYIQSNGVLTKTSDKLIFKKDNEGFVLEGEDSDLFYKIYPYLTGTVSSQEILKSINVDEKESLKFFDNLEEIGIVSVKNKPFASIGVVSESFDQQELSKQFNSLFLKDFIKCIDLKEINKNNIDLVLVIEKDTNIAYFNKINQYLRNKDIPWLKYSFDNNNLYLGPLFFYDGGPCYECFTTRKNRNRDNDLEIWESSMGNSVNLLGPFIEKELLKLANLKSPSLCFNTEINFDVFNLEILKYPVYKLPDCKGCGGEYLE